MVPVTASLQVWRDRERLRDLVVDAWSMVVPKSVAAAYAERHPA